MSASKVTPLIFTSPDDNAIGNQSTWWYTISTAEGATNGNVSDDLQVSFDEMACVYFWLTAVMSVLSIGGSVILIATDLAFRDLRTPGRRLLTWLSVVDGLTACGNFLGILWYIWGNKEQSPLCQFHALLTIFSSIGSFLWTVVIATHLYLHVCRNNARLANRLIRPFHVVCWTIPAVVAVTAWSMDVVGYDGSNNGPSWCWIKSVDGDHNAVVFWQYMTGKAWEIACYFAIIGLYVPVKYTLHKQVRKRMLRERFLLRNATTNSYQSTPSMATLQRRRNALNCNVIVDANRRLIFVPIVFLTLRVWGTIRFLVGAHGSSGVREAMEWIIPLQGMGDSSQGLANCIMFCFLTERVRRRYLELRCWRTLSCRRRRRRLSSTGRPRGDAVIVGCATNGELSSESGSSDGPSRSSSDGVTGGDAPLTAIVDDSRVVNNDVDVNDEIAAVTVLYQTRTVVDGSTGVERISEITSSMGVQFGV